MIKTQSKYFKIKVYFDIIGVKGWKQLYHKKGVVTRYWGNLNPLKSSDPLEVLWGTPCNDIIAFLDNENNLIYKCPVRR